MKITDLTNNVVIPHALKASPMFQGEWWKNKEFWRKTAREEKSNDLEGTKDDIRHST